MPGTERSCLLGLCVLAVAITLARFPRSAVARKQPATKPRSKADEAGSTAELLRKVRQAMKEAAALTGRGEYAKALPRSEAVLRGLRQLYGSRDHPNVAATLYNVGGCLHMLARPAEAARETQTDPDVHGIPGAVVAEEVLLERHQRQREDLRRLSPDTRHARLPPAAEGRVWGDISPPTRHARPAPRHSRRDTRHSSKPGRGVSRVVARLPKFVRMANRATRISTRESTSGQGRWPAARRVWV